MRASPAEAGNLDFTLASLITGVSEWADFDTKAHLDTKVDVIIAGDNTAYPFKNGQEYYKILRLTLHLQGKSCE